MATPQTTPPVLDISTLVTRQHVRIDGKLYPLRTIDEFPYLFTRTTGAKFKRVGELLQRKRRSKTQDREKSRLLDECCRTVLDAPAAVHQKLSDRQRMDITTVFSLLLQQKRKAAAGAKPATATSAPAKRRARTASTTSRTGAPSPPA